MIGVDSASLLFCSPKEWEKLLDQEYEDKSFSSTVRPGRLTSVLTSSCASLSPCDSLSTARSVALASTAATILSVVGRVLTAFVEFHKPSAAVKRGRLRLKILEAASEEVLAFRGNVA